MSGISFIRRDWGDVVSIVRIVSEDDLATVGGANYISNQAANITAANNGVFDWLANDSVLVSASDGSALFTISSDLLSLIPIGAQQISVSLTAAQIKAMYDTPVLLVPAPPAGSMNVVTSAYLNIDFNSAQYASGGAIAIQYKSTVHGGGTAATATIAAATLNAVAADETLVFSPVSSILWANAAAQPLYLSNATGDFTTGDSPATLVVVYRNVIL